MAEKKKVCNYIKEKRPKWIMNVYFIEWKSYKDTVEEIIVSIYVFDINDSFF